MAGTEWRDTYLSSFEEITSARGMHCHSPMSTSSPLSLSLALALCAGLALAACSGSTNGSGDGGPNPLGCPTSQPSGGGCALANGTTCTYGSGGPCGYETVAVCDNGQWTFEATGAPAGAGLAACPSTVPAQGSPCSNPPSCGGAQPANQCSYGCDQGGPAFATCNGSTWTVSYEGIACTVDASIDVVEPGDAGVGCHAEADCGSVGYCRAPGGPYLTGFSLGVTCSSDAQCGADADVPSCNGGACVCQSTQYSPRPAPGTQAPGYCMVPCTTNTDCSTTLGPLYGDAAGFVCGTGGHCVPRACAAPADCPASFDCAANQCVRRSCSTDVDCAPAGACVDGACYSAAGSCQPLPG